MGDTLPDKLIVKEFVLTLRERVSPSACNIYIRGMNSFFTWLFENGIIPEKLKIKQLKTTKKVIKPFNDDDLRCILSFKRSSLAQFRIWVLACVLIDTGIRIDSNL